MRLKMLLISSLLFLTFLVVTAICVNWDDPDYDVDKMIAEEDVHISSPQETPWESRERQKNKSSLDWTMPNTLAGGGDSAKESRDTAELSSETANASTTAESATIIDNTTATTNTELPLVQSEAVTAEGNWYFTLNDSVVRNLVMSLFQNGNDIYGAGKIKEGNSTMDVAVSGTIADSTLELNLVSTNPIVQYKLNFSMDEDRASGEYQASSANGETWTGTAKGEKTS
jgi:hypothetical protein